MSASIVRDMADAIAEIEAQLKTPDGSWKGGVSVGQSLAQLRDAVSRASVYATDVRAKYAHLAELDRRAYDASQRYFDAKTHQQTNRLRDAWRLAADEASNYRLANGL